jgi:hypothetical protein
VKIDGLAASYTPSAWAAVINSRLAVPSYISIDVDIVGNASGGTAYFNITAEQAPSVTGDIKIFSAIVENNFTAPAGWGGYSGMEMMYVPRDDLAGATGTVITFTGPYPQTVEVTGPAYTIVPTSWNFNNLRVVTLVQQTGGTREVLNAHYMDLPDSSPTGVEDPSEGTLSTSMMSVWPNPCSGSTSVMSTVAAGYQGTVTIFDITGHQVAQFPAGGMMPITIDEAGVYIARLNTTNGEIVNSSFTVVE